MRKYWWKILAYLLLLTICTEGFLVKVPLLDGRLQQSIRNTFFHVPMWFSMMIFYIVSAVYSIIYLYKPGSKNDHHALEFARVGVVYCILGLITGAIWATYQWGDPSVWKTDPKLVGAALSLLIYLAYFVLRGSIADPGNRAKISAVYNIFAFAMLFPTIWILPRTTESLHPGGQGAEGNPGLNPNDASTNVAIFLWLGVIGWTLLGVWITTLRVRLQFLIEKKLHG
ncbi:MAG TPA: cytochrome c biogenesis protein CcsA [Chitinophagaceae bacterium]|nr:cytochrome c biogenesis protein CcsA [Chitinophagaceae bacterium]